MSAPVAGPSAQPPPPTELSLTGITVKFLAKRPKSKIKLTITLDRKDHVFEIDKDGSVEWSGDIRCQAGTNVTVHTNRLNRIRRWKKFASVETSLTQNPSPVTDVNRQIEVSLTVKNPQFSDTITGLAAAEAIVEKKIPIVEKLEPILRVLDVLASIGEAVKDIHPAIGYTVAAINALIKLCKMQETCRKAALDLVEQVTAFLSIEKYVEKLKKREETRRAVQVMLGLISETSNYICEKTRTGLGGIIGDLLGTEYAEKIGKFQKDFVRAKESFDRSVQLEILDIVDSIESKILLDKLAACDHAYFTSNAGCLEGTRADLRQRVEHWINDADATQPNLFWLFGHAGSGKSTVAHTIAKMAEDPVRGFGLSCFFCKRDDSDLSNSRRLLPTLAFSLAQHYGSYRAAIMKFLRSPRVAGIATTADVETQFTRLFGELFVDTVDPLRPHVLVIDALDECGSSKEQAELVTYILALSRAVPWMKVFVTSRNEPAINKAFAQTTDCIWCNIHDEKGTDDDIRAYIESEARDLDLSDEDVAQLARKADGLFIWCSTVLKYLHDGLEPTDFLRQLLSDEIQDQVSEPWDPLYKLYDNVLEFALEMQESDAVSFMRTILLIINVSSRNQPLSVNAITSFLHGCKLHMRFNVKSAEKVIKGLHSVLYVDTNSAVRAHHTSIYDFLQWKASPSSKSGWQNSDEIEGLMAQSCLRTLHEKLRFNICDIETPVLNKDIPDLATRISARISEELKYSTHHWFTHVASSILAITEVQHAILKLLCSKKVLFWFECMSLLGSLDRIRFTFRKFMRPLIQGHPDIMAAVEDTCRFTNSFADAMDSIAHIYLSALWWLPENSLMYWNLGLSKRTSWKLIENKPNNWDALVWKSDPIRVQSVTFSPDGRFVAYGAEDGVVYIRDSQTGTLEGEPLRAHQNAVYSVAYSHDSCFIASCSTDCTVRIWDTKSREASLGPLEGHSDWVRCVAYSPDGLLLASGSEDNTIRIWSTCTGKLQGEPLQHSDWVRAVAYSPDGRFIASACDDHYVHVWDTASHQEASKFQGHQGYVRSVAYSPDGHAIVSGSQDNTIRVWDAKTGEVIGELLPGHANSVNSVTYSPDGHSILSGSDDGTVRLWDALTHTALGEPLKTHSGQVEWVSYSPDGSLIASASSGGVCGWDTSTSFEAGGQSQDPSVQANTQAVYAVAYSPDGRCIASGSGHSDQIRMWNAQTGVAMSTPVLRHAGMNPKGDVQSITYSRDGHFIVSGSNDKDNSSVCVLDAQTGDIISGPLRGHSDSIWSVAYSPDGGCVASASEDSTVCLWDLQTGAAIGEPLEVNSPANSVAFSPDGHVFACGTDNGSIWIWDAHSKAPIRDPIQAHSSRIYSVAFSPDGRFIVSGSADHSVRIWDAQTGKVSRGSLQGHQDGVLCVAYSPDGQFIALGSYREVLIWDAESGLACGEPLRGHSDRVVRSVAYSPEGRFLASGSDDGRIYVRRVSNDHDDVEARWLSICSHLYPQDGWITDGETLLLWVPAPYRSTIQSRAKFVLPNPTPNITAYSIDHHTLLRFSGRNWVDIIADFDE